jgi:tetratricopeptide (TPR) repeat protein
VVVYVVGMKKGKRYSGSVRSTLPEWREIRAFIIAFAFLVFLGSGFLLYRHFYQPPPLEEKFVLEEITVKPTETEASLPLAEPLTPSPTVTLVRAGNKVLLPATQISYQTFNNCGPANLSMILSYYKINRTQEELAAKLRPYQHAQGNNDDKTVFPREFVMAVESFGLKALVRPNGTLRSIKLLLANDIPVVVKTLLKKTEDSAHFRIVRGFDEEKQLMIVDDSYFGPHRKISYFDFLSMWQPFNYLYIPVYREDKQTVVKAIIGEEMDEEVAYWRAINRAQQEIAKDSENVWPKFNLAKSFYHVGQFGKSVEEFEKIEAALPRRALWYQIEPILAYRELGNNKRVFEIIERVLNDGNRAFSELYQIRGEIYLDQGKQEAAKREFELALKYNQNFQPAGQALSGL